MGSSTGLFCVGPNKVKAFKSFLFTGGPLKVGKKEHLFDITEGLFISVLSPLFS